MEQFQAVVENRTGFCLDPRTKLLLMAVVATAEFLYSHTAFMIAVAMIPFVLLLTNRQYKTATVFFCLFAAGLFVQAIQNSVQFPMIVNMLVMQDVNHQLFTEDVLDELLLSMGGEDEKADTARAKEILNSLDLLDKVKLHPMSLSGGEKQRVAIGSAIASDKKILIFDEPTSGLDYRHMLEVSDNLNRLKEMGKSLFLITHDPELIYKCCTYLLFIQGSKVLWHRPMDGEAVKLLRAFFSHEQETGAVNAS